MILTRCAWPPRRVPRGLVRALLPLALLISATGARSEPSRWTPVPGKCEVFFDATHPLGPFSGRTENLQGEFRLDPADLKLGVTGSLWISARGLKTGAESRDREMRKALGVDQFPEIRYTIDSVEASYTSTATTMYREMDMRFYLEQAEAEFGGASEGNVRSDLTTAQTPSARRFRTRGCCAPTR